MSQADMTADEKRLFAVLVGGLLFISLGTFAMAAPETTTIDGGCCAPNQVLAKDFSAYYTAAWRLFHDPAQIYFHGLVNDGGPAIPPKPQGYKYLPSFLVLVSPLLLLSYGSALSWFDIVQFALLPAVAALLYFLLRGRGLVVTSVVTTAVLVLPLPLVYAQSTLSASYYWQWAEGQSKVLQTFLLLSALALTRSGRPRLGAVMFAVGAFDPRFAVLAAPLMVAYTKDLRTTIVYSAAAFVIINAPLFYPPTLAGFFSMIFTSGAATPPFPYTFIPIVALLLLMYVDRREIVSAFRALGRKDSSWSGRAQPSHEAGGRRDLGASPGQSSAAEG